MDIQKRFTIDFKSLCNGLKQNKIVWFDHTCCVFIEISCPQIFESSGCLISIMCRVEEEKMEKSCNCKRIRELNLAEQSAYFEIYDLYMFLNFDAHGTSVDDYCIDIFEDRENEEDVIDRRSIHLGYDDLKQLVTQLIKISVEIAQSSTVKIEQPLYTESGDICLEWCPEQLKIRITTASGILYMFKHEADELVNQFRYGIAERINVNRHCRCLSCRPCSCCS